MKYCKFCGQQLSDQALFCARCGKSVGAQIQSAPVYAPASKKSVNIVCILGFVFSLLGSMTIVGLILSIIGYNQVKNTDDKTGKALSKAGIIISSVILGIVVLVYAILIGYLI